MTLGHQLLAADRMSDLLAEAENERLVSMARRERLPAGRIARATATVRALLPDAAARRRTRRAGALSTLHEPRGQGVPSLPVARHRAW